ncbi:MAG: transcription termination factor NusA, partial [bacterium]
QSPILDAIDQICDEKNIPRQAVLDTIEAALAVAYRKDFGEKNQNIKAEFNPETAQARVFDVKEVVEDELYEEYVKQQEELERLRAEGQEPDLEQPAAPQIATPVVPPTDGTGEVPAPAEEEKVRRFDPKSMIAVSEVKKTKKDAAIGDVIRTELFPPENYGRMAAQTAKQVIIQRLREAERETTYQEFKDKVGEILTGTVQRVEGRVVLIDLGRATAIMPPGEQIDRERYLPGQRIKVYIAAVTATTRGPEIVVSRAHPDMVKKLFSLEVPEVASGAITIKAIAREAGSRTKIAVHTTETNIDPVGSCVGQRGTRVQTIIAEIGGEKIDIIQFEDDPVRFIINALSPAKVLSVQLNQEERRAKAEVKEDQLSLAIGRSGQNVRLAARLTSWRIDIIKESSEEVVGGSEGAVKPKPEIPEKAPQEVPPEQKADVTPEEPAAAPSEKNGVAPTETAQPEKPAASVGSTPEEPPKKTDSAEEMS